MPALPSVPQVLRLKYDFSYGEDTQVKCHLFLQYTGTAPSNSDLVTFANAVMSDANTNLKGLMGVDTILSLVEVTDLTSPTAAFGQSTHSAITGTRSGAVLPASTCMLWSMPIHRRYRGGHPRIYWPFGTQSDMTDPQTWDTAFTGQTDTDVSNHITAIQGAPWAGATIPNQVNVSFYSGFTNHTGTTGREKAINTVRSSPVIDTILSGIAQVGIAIIRKRLLKLA